MVVLTVKNPLDNAGGARDMDSIPGSGRSPRGGNGNSFSILAWRIPWTEKTGGLWSTGSQRVGHDWAQIHTHNSKKAGKESKMHTCGTVEQLTAAYYWL